jgi:hypothetical protein
MMGYACMNVASNDASDALAVQFFETDKRQPIANNLSAIRRALEDAGVEFGVDADLGHC